MMYNIIEDLTTLTTIPESALVKLMSKYNMLISDYVLQDKLTSNDITQINIGIGTLIISNTDYTLSYKFIPSLELEESLVNSLRTKSSPLEITLEKALSERITKTYKDLF